MRSWICCWRKELTHTQETYKWISIEFFTRSMRSMLEHSSNEFLWLFRVLFIHFLLFLLAKVLCSSSIVAERNTRKKKESSTRYVNSKLSSVTFGCISIIMVWIIAKQQRRRQKKIRKSNELQTNLPANNNKWRKYKTTSNKMN